MTLRRNYDDGHVQHFSSKLHPQPSKQDYQILLEFDLKREKEKNLILEQRLRNKELFIQQMKHFQEELTAAYEQCKNELIFAQQKIEYLQNVEFREYTEQIADLKHMLILKNSQEAKRDSVNRDERSAFSSLNNKTFKNRSEKVLPSKSYEKRQSKTTSNVATVRDRSAERFNEDLRKDFKKVSNFVQHFIQMAQFYVVQLQSEEKLSKKLKRSWKWIKDVVKEWDQHAEEIKVQQKFKSELAQLYKVSEDVENSILLQLIKESNNN